MLHRVVGEVTVRLELRSQKRRQACLARLQEAAERPARQYLGCSNLAHALAAQPAAERLIIKQGGAPHIAIIYSFNDLLSAHPSAGLSATTQDSVGRGGRHRAVCCRGAGHV